MKGNKGFSLVEVIVVIAVMAVLTGVVAPQFIKYCEKANVSADTQYCDTVRSAFMLMLSDPKFSANDNLDSTSKFLVTELTTPGRSGNFSVYSIGGTNFAAYDFINEIVGTDVFTATSGQYFKSSPARSSGILSYKVSDEGILYIFINNSDNTGSKIGHSVNSSSPMSDYNELICVPVVCE